MAVEHPTPGSFPAPESGRGRPLLWLVFTANCLVFLAALLLLAFSPVTVDAPIEIDQFALLLAGLSCSWR